MLCSPPDRRLVLLGTLSVALFIGHPASADEPSAENPITVAEEHLGELRFEDARTVATTALHSGTRGPKEVAQLYMVLARVSASLGEEAEARAQFHSALSIHIDAVLPDGVSPKLSAPFEAARALLDGASPIALEGERGEGNALRVTVSSDPANLVGGAELSYGPSAERETLRGQGRDTIELEVPEEISDFSVVALDQYGNALSEPKDLRLGSDSAPAQGEPGVTASSSPPLYQRWELYAGTALAVAVGGGYLGYDARTIAGEVEDLEDGTEFSAARRLEDKAKQRALYANISFAAAGLLGAAAYWAYTQADSEVPAASASTVVVPLASEHQIGIAAALSF